MHKPYAVDRFLYAVRTATTDLCDAWARDVVLDATVPHCRFHRKGPDEVRGVFGRWYSHPGSYDEPRRVAIPGGEVVDFVLSWTEDGIPHAVHQIHMLELEGDRIVRTFVHGDWKLDNVGITARSYGST